MKREALDVLFTDMIHRKGIETILGVERNYVYQLRSKIKNGVAISSDTKYELLRKSGWRDEEEIFRRKDLVSLVNFVLRQGAKAKEFGAEYLIEKWEKK